MANKSARDKCFEEATDAYNDSVVDSQKIKIEHQKPWGQGDDGKWSPFGVLDRIWEWIKNPDAVYRVPDWTIEIDGKPVAGDNKFEGDKYSSRKGRSGKTQLEDQNQMNEDQNPGKEDYQDLNLNPDKCNCDEDPQPQEVLVPATAPYREGVPVIPGVPLGGLPLPAPVPAPVVEPLPIFGEPIPIF